jgi:hypothetical protein
MSDITILPAPPAAADQHATHAVFNQPPPFEGVNLFTADRPLAEALRREGAEWAEERVRAFGELVGRRETIAWGFQANENPPVLRTHDRRGERIDEVEFHPAWHALMELGVEHALHALPWREPRPGAHVARESLAALFAEIDRARGGDARLDAFVADLRRDLGDANDLETRARRLVERLALALQASLLVRHAPAAVADAFCASRLGADGGRAFGTLPAGTAFGEILERALSSDAKGQQGWQG